MQTDALVTFSALLIGIALAGGVAAMRSHVSRSGRILLVIVFGLFAALVALPVVGRFFQSAFPFYLPALLPVLMVLPVVVHRYAHTRIQPGSFLSWSWRDHLLPLTGAMIMIGYWLLPAQDQSALFLEGVLPQGRFPALLALLTFAMVLIWTVSSLVYLIITLRALGRYRARLKAYLSNTERYELRWVSGLIMALIGTWVLAALSLLGDNLQLGLIIPVELVFAMTGLVLLMLVSFATLPELDTPFPSPSDAGPEKYARSALSEVRAQQIAKKIETAMQCDALYLDPTLSLQKLSKHVAAPHNHVSQTLNTQLGSTFFDYIAHWRVQAAKPMVAAGEVSVLTIALDVGFNSRSTFYKAFKQQTGLTPKAFRAQSTHTAL